MNTPQSPRPATPLGRIGSALSWPRRRLRAFVEWAMWSRQRFVGVLIAATVLVGLALTVAITTVAVSVQTAVGAAAASSATTSPNTATPASGAVPTYDPRDLATGDPRTSKPSTPSPTTTLTAPPYTAGPEAAARNFAVHWLDGANRPNGSDERARWVAELLPLCNAALEIPLRNTRQEQMPVASIINATTVERMPGAGWGGTVTTFDLSNGSILAVEVQRQPGGDAPWIVWTYRHNQ